METTETHRHEFYLTSTFVGRESGATFYVGTCACGATEANTVSGKRLLEAARLLDAMVDGATPGPWKMWNGWGPTAEGFMGVERLGPDSGERVFHHDSQPDLFATRADFEYIAHMHPGVGKALAAWLRDFAPYADEALDGHLALAVADAILGAL